MLEELLMQDAGGVGMDSCTKLFFFYQFCVSGRSAIDVVIIVYILLAIIGAAVGLIIFAFIKRRKNRQNAMI
jgi:hypothetical protein